MTGLLAVSECSIVLFLKKMMIPRGGLCNPPLRYDFSLITDYKLHISGLGVDSVGWIGGGGQSSNGGMVAIRKIAILFAVVIGRARPSGEGRI